MDDYTFRLRINLPKSSQLAINTPTHEMSGLFEYQIELSSGGPELLLKDSNRLIFRASGFETEQEAFDQAEHFSDVLMIALASLKMGADFGARAPKGGFTKYGLSKFEESAGKKILNDVHGMMVFPSDLTPAFLSTAPPTVIIGRNPSDFEKALSSARIGNIPLSNRERLAFDIFSSSFLEGSQDARLLTLMMALEVLITQIPRPQESITLVNSFIETTRESSEISESERNSILGSLSWLLKESVSQAGRRFVTERLGKEEYMEMECDKFFNHCYAIRSELIHGHEPFPTRSEVSAAAANLETLVADIITAEAMKNAP
ncbi:MAG: hypothetical protein IH953_04510 [Chloroflexi bacterium]|nr:hypothetical protein [Chloroflexota bacterium]